METLIAASVVVRRS